MDHERNVPGPGDHRSPNEAIREVGADRNSTEIDRGFRHLSEAAQERVNVENDCRLSAEGLDGPLDLARSRVGSVCACGTKLESGH
jgi:hypothetical protein